MIYYKLNNEVFAYETEEFFSIYGNPDAVKMSESEVEEHLNKNTTSISDIERAERNYLLSELDQIVSNPLRWSEFTEEQKQQLIEYRQLLLDVPQQETFPHAVDWPEKPSFI